MPLGGYDSRVGSRNRGLIFIIIIIEGIEKAEAASAGGCAEPEPILAEIQT